MFSTHARGDAWRRGSGSARGGTRWRATALAVVTAAAGGAVAATAADAVTPSPAYAADGCARADIYAAKWVGPPEASVTPVAGAKFGAAVVTGDFNKDGYADVAIGAPNDAVGSTSGAGAVYVFPGSATGIGTGKRLTQANVTNFGPETGDRFGASLAVGDFNKDAYVDLAVGSPGETVGDPAVKSGAIAVFTGKAAGLTTGTGYTETLAGETNEASDAFGTALAAGDINKDGYADLAIGTPGEIPASETTRGGAVYVAKGSASGLVKGWSLKQENATGNNTEADDEFGAALAIGNVTGDSYPDLVVGAPGEAPGSDPADSGAVFVFPGASTGTATGFSLTQSAANGANEGGDRLGAALAVGDFNKDGRADIAAGLPGEAPDAYPAGGSVVIFPGAATKVSTGYWLNESGGGEPIAAGSKFGASLATGDVDKDGFADLLVGAPGKTYGSASAAGVTYLFRGHAAATGTTAGLTYGRRIAQPDILAGNETNDAFGSAVALGDITGDGKAEAAVGLSGEKPASGVTTGSVVTLTNLAPPALPISEVEAYSRTGAIQVSPVAGTVGVLEYAFVDNIGRLLHGRQENPSDFVNIQWTVISGNEAFTGPPALAEQQDGRLQVLAHNTSGDMWTRTQAEKGMPTWNAWTAALGPMASEAAVARQEDGRVVGFAVDSRGLLWALSQVTANGGYSSWTSLNLAGLKGTPTVIPVSGGIRVFATDTDGSIKTALYAGGFLSGCTSLAGSGFSPTPAAVMFPGNRLRLMARAADGTIQTMMQSTAGVFPDTWDITGNFTATGSPSALLDPKSGKTVAVARSAVDKQIYATEEVLQASATWREWTATGVPGYTEPTAFIYADGSGQKWAFVARNIENEMIVAYPQSLSSVPVGGPVAGFVENPAELPVA